MANTWPPAKSVRSDFVRPILRVAAIAPWLAALVAANLAAVTVAQAPPAERPTRDELLKILTAYEEAYLPYHVSVLKTIRFAEPLTPAKRNHPWGDGRKHQKLVEYAQRGPLWVRRETNLVNDVVGAQYEWFCDGKQVVTFEEGGPNQPPRVNIFRRKSEIQRLPHVQPLLGVFPLSIFTEGDLVSRVVAKDPAAVELAWEGNDAKLTVNYGGEYRMRAVVTLSREHDWHPKRMQHFVLRDREIADQDWTVTKFSREGNRWRIAAGTVQHFVLPERKLDHFEDFEIIGAKYGDDVKDGIFEYHVPANARVQIYPELAAEEEVQLSRVVDAAGRPIAGAQVSIIYRVEGVEPWPAITTDSQGRFAYPANLPANDQFTVKVDAEGYLFEARTGNRNAYLMENGKRVPDRFVLLRPATIAGKLIGADGAPIANARLTVTCLKDKQLYSNGAITDAEGRFRLNNQQPGLMVVQYTLRAPGGTAPLGVQRSSFGIARAEVASGDAVDDVVIDMSQARCVIDGTLVDHDGAGVSGVQVRLGMDAHGWGTTTYFLIVMTDAEGHFRFENLPPGNFQLVSSTLSLSLNSTTVTTVPDRPVQVRLPDYFTGSPPPADRDWKPLWGQPNAAGVEMALELEPRKADYRVGERISARVLCRNAGNKAVYFANTFAMGELQVVDRDGRSLQAFSFQTLGAAQAKQLKYHLEPEEEVSLGTFTMAMVTPGGNDGAALLRTTFAVFCEPGKPVQLQCGFADWKTAITPLQVQAAGAGN